MYWTTDPEHPLTKVCSKCKVEKHLMEFYLQYEVGTRRPDCKACKRAHTRRYWAANGPRCRAKARERYAARPEVHLAQGRRWRERHPEQARQGLRRYRRGHRRRELVRQATKALHALGLIEVEDRCADCGGGPVELHHPDYGDPFHVVPLCRRCHMRRHWAEWRRTGGGPVKYPEEYAPAPAAQRPPPEDGDGTQAPEQRPRRNGKPATAPEDGA